MSERTRELKDEFLGRYNLVGSRKRYKKKGRKINREAARGEKEGNEGKYGSKKRGKIWWAGQGRI